MIGTGSSWFLGATLDGAFPNTETLFSFSEVSILRARGESTVISVVSFALVVIFITNALST